jgi:hypothetical protein
MSKGPGVQIELTMGKAKAIGNWLLVVGSGLWASIYCLSRWQDTGNAAAH